MKLLLSGFTHKKKELKTASNYTAEVYCKNMVVKIIHKKGGQDHTYKRWSRSYIQKVVKIIHTKGGQDHTYKRWSRSYI